MSRHGETSFDWADGHHTFRLGIGELRELQEKTDAGPLELVARIRNGRWRIDDLAETLRLGLIGGGMKPVKALQIVARYVHNRPWLESTQPALAVLMAGLAGAEDEPLGKPQAPGPETSSPTESSASPSSTAPAPQSDTPPTRSTA